MAFVLLVCHMRRQVYFRVYDAYVIFTFLLEYLYVIYDVLFTIINRIDEPLILIIFNLPGYYIL